uniref:Phosphoenolpyruvate carboxylase family protein n=1 Tax=Tanacetum cinerariifolium TaxID=118510 RepID=A0A6L2MT84_TANCI|nr:phosphoenolpyruvate carboxylase family protein [Tanacetum cinerariifolium]
MLDQGRLINEAVSIPVIGDGDNGYANAMNVKTTFKGFIKAGFARILLEDHGSNTTLRKHITHPHCEDKGTEEPKFESGANVHGSRWEGFQGSNTTLRNHITHFHCEVIKAQKNQNPEAGQTSMARDESVFRYDMDYLREQFAGLMIQRALPFNHFDHEQTTRVFQNTMQPRYTHVSRSTLKRDAMRLWLAAKQEIIDSFGNLNACVNLTTDVWSAPLGVAGSYMCVTAHWIEPDKVMSITLDNGSNNTSAMDKLKLKSDPPMGGRDVCTATMVYVATIGVLVNVKALRVIKYTLMFLGVGGCSVLPWWWRMRGVVVVRGDDVGFGGGVEMMKIWC